MILKKNMYFGFVLKVLVLVFLLGAFSNVLKAQSEWPGTTSQGRPMSFDVSGDGTEWSDFELEIRINTPYGSFTPTFTKPGPGNIINGEFSSSGSFSFTGSFNSPTNATGTYAFNNYLYVISIPYPPYIYHYYINQSGNWTARLKGVPIVSTNTVTSVTENSAVCGGNVTSEGDSPVTQRGVCWSTSPNPAIADNITNDGAGPGFFTSNITGLSPDTTYYVRAYATNSLGTSYGEPEWDFYTGSTGIVDHFELSVIPSPQNIGIAFSITVTSKDVNNFIVEEFSDLVNIDGLIENITNPFSDNFEDGNYDGWNPAMNKEVTDLTSAVGTYCFTITGGSENIYSDCNVLSMYYPLPDLTPDKIEFYVRSSDNSKEGGYFVAVGGSGSSDTLIRFYMKSNGQMGIYHGPAATAETPYVSNQWYKITIDINWSTDYIDFYVDDVLVDDDINFASPYAYSIKKIYLYNHDSDSQAWWDEIELIEDDTTQFFDDFEDGNYIGWTSTVINEVTDQEASSGNYSFTIKSNTEYESFNGVSQDLPNLTPDIIEFYVKSSDKSKSDGYFVVGTGPSTDQSAVYFRMASDGQMGIYENYNSHEVPYDEHTWYKIILKFDWVAKNVDFFVNDSLVENDIPFADPNVSYLTKVYLYNSGLNTQAWWDEIKFLNIDETEILITPLSSDNFISGVWTGNITVLEEASGMCIRVNDNNGHVGQSNIFNVINAPPPSIEVISPNGGESWDVGSSYNITWTSTGIIANVKIEYSINNGSNWSTETTSTPNDGVYNWTVLDTPSSLCLVKISEASGGTPSDTSDDVFTISSGVIESITVISPNGGENWKDGTIETITWTSTGLSGNIDIELYKGGTMHSSIGTDSVLSGYFNWNIPSGLTPGSDYSVRIYQGAIEDFSDSNFSIIDFPLPIEGIDWNTFLGSGTSDDGYNIATDNFGNIYVIGDSADSWGSPVNAHSGSQDAFVACLDSNGNLLWNTFLGSIEWDWGRGIILDSSGNIYVIGYSEDVWGTPINSFGGGQDAFVACLDNSGNLLWNTFLGCIEYDYGRDIALDSSGNIFVTGYSESTWGSPINTHAGNTDVFICKLDINGNLVWNTFTGSSGGDEGHGIILDDSGNIFSCGNSTDTWGTPLNPHAGGDDAFVVKLDNNGNLIWNSFMGGSGNDFSFGGIKLDGIGNIYVSGSSYSTWGSPIDPYIGDSDIFVAKLDSSGNPVWNTFLGSLNTDQCWGIAGDGSGNIWVTGYSEATWGGSPVNAYSGDKDIFAAQLDNNGNLLWNTFLGNITSDTGYAAILDSNKNLLITGGSNSNWGNPINAFSGSSDAFIVKIPNLNEPIPDIKANDSDGPISITQSDTLQIRVSLNTFGSTANADFWLAYKGPSGWVHYNKKSKSWDPGLGVTHQGALFDLNNKRVFQASGLSLGTYRFYFGVDLNMNGIVTKSSLYSDMVKVTVTQ